MFIGKDVISGSVELELSKAESIREVNVAFRGEITHLTQEPTPFIQLSRSLIKQPTGKLSGKHIYPYSFVLPDDVTIDEPNWAMVYPLPPKYHEKGILYIDYKIVVTVRRGMFAVDSSLTTNIVYLPETIADRPSTLRERAYLEERPLTLPTLDPNGWKLLSPVEAEGTLVPNAIVTAQLSIASPLSFALGSPIPLYLDLRNDQGAPFDISMADVRLVRVLTTRNATGGVRKVDVARAVFWSAPGSSLHRIRLWGEVVAGKRLTPGFDFSKCNVRYAIILYPTHPPVQIPSKRQPLLEEEILLGLRNAPSVVPRSQAPSGLIPAPLERQPTILPPRHYPVDFGLIL